MLSTAGLSPVAQLFPGTSGPSPVELAPVAPEWPITPIASNSAVRSTDTGSGPVLAAAVEAAVSVSEFQPQAVTPGTAIRKSASTAADARDSGMGRCTAAPPVLRRWRHPRAVPGGGQGMLRQPGRRALSRDQGP